MKFKLWLETEYDELMAQYTKIEPQLLNNPIIQQELATTGMVMPSTFKRVLGNDPIVNFYNREFNKRHQNPAQQAAYSKVQDAEYMKTRRDDFYYHVLPSKRLRAILKQGLQPNKEAVFSNYQNHSRGRIFLCEKEGVEFWKSRVQDHLFHNGQNEKLSVIKIPKSVVQVEPDEVGTKDASSPSYFTSTPIAPQNIQVV